MIDDFIMLLMGLFHNVLALLVRLPSTVLGYNGFSRCLPIEDKNSIQARKHLNHQTTVVISTVDDTRDPLSWRQLQCHSDSEVTYYAGDNDIDNDFIDIDDLSFNYMSDDGVDGEDSRLSSGLSQCMPSLFRNSSIQDRSLKLAHMRRRHIRRKRSFRRFCSSGGESEKPSNRSLTPNTSENSMAHMHSSAQMYNSDKGNSGQSDTVETFTAETEQVHWEQGTSQTFIRTNSIQKKSWDIRRRRKEIMCKRRTENFI